MDKETKNMKEKQPKKSEQSSNISSAWIQMKTGLILMGILSIVLAGWVVIQSDKAIPFGERVLWGLGFGLSLWIIFAVFYAINRFVFKRK